MRKRDEELYNDPWDRDFYETGSTRPPKNRGGVVAFLLVGVIVLVSTTRAMGIINLQRLRQQLEQREANTMTLFDPAQAESSVTVTLPLRGDSEEDCGVQQWLRIDGVTVSSFDRRFYAVPYGYLVTQVEEGSRAQEGGVRSGDVIISLNGQRILSAGDLETLLQQCGDGSVTLEVYRSHTDERHTLTVILEKEE